MLEIPFELPSMVDETEEHGQPSGFQNPSIWAAIVCDFLTVCYKGFHGGYETDENPASGHLDQTCATTTVVAVTDVV